MSLGQPYVYKLRLVISEDVPLVSYLPQCTLNFVVLRNYEDGKIVTRLRGIWPPSVIDYDGRVKTLVFLLSWISTCITSWCCTKLWN